MRYNITVYNIRKQNNHTHTLLYTSLLSSLPMPLLPPTLSFFITLPVTLHDILSLTHLLYAALTYAALSIHVYVL